MNSGPHGQLFCGLRSGKAAVALCMSTPPWSTCHDVHMTYMLAETAKGPERDELCQRLSADHADGAAIEMAANACRKWTESTRASWRRVLVCAMVSHCLRTASPAAAALKEMGAASEWAALETLVRTVEEVGATVLPVKDLEWVPEVQESLGATRNEAETCAAQAEHVNATRDAVEIMVEARVYMLLHLLQWSYT